MSKQTVLIAAYGTLREGERNAGFCKNALSRRMGVVAGTLFDTGYGYPAFQPEGDSAVTVEVIEIPLRDWAAIDALEGYPSLYDRMLTDIGLADCASVKAWIYVMNRLPPHARIIRSGDWKTSPQRMP